ncbi:MAG: DNA primase [Bacteroidia bacterium]|jgi:DNA primase|nr:DNA primase [Bacteroidia bacterium]GIV23341.1 MAG: hypothetical protein KatS3mg025_1000 [Bacteroidia bacterium]
MSWLRDEVLRRADIVEVVSEYIPLKKRGSNYWALSPFKPERTPSFAVSPTKQIFKCFASGKGGDVIRFVMEMEGLSYGEALRKLAEKYGIAVPDTQEERYTSRERQRYLALYEAVVQFYQRRLTGSPAEAYLVRRGVTRESIERFRLGYAPPEGQALTEYLLRLGYEEETLVKWGVALRQEGTGRLYDRFRGRVIFPVIEEQGGVVALAGRLLADEADQPKYLNSPETPFYRKSEVLYGLWLARPVLRKEGAALIVEGYMDVISLHQAGFTQAVATCGTALTEEHLIRLRRYTREVVLLYDSDSAGQAAAERAIEPALRAGFFVRVAHVPEGKDPDAFLQEKGPEAFQEVLHNSLSWPLYLAQRVGPTPSPQERYTLLQKLGQGLQALPDPYLRRAYAEEIATSLHIPPEFWESFERIEAPPRSPEAVPPTRVTAERELLRVAFTYPEVDFGGLPLWAVLQEELKHLTFTQPEAEALRKAFCSWGENRPPSLQDLMEALLPEVQDWATGLLLERYTLSEHWRTWDDSPLVEDPVQIAESNLNLLHLAHVQHLLQENLRILETLLPETPSYEEHLVLHQVLLRQRAEIALRQGLILPYRQAEG